MDCSIIIVTWNSRGYIAQCLASLPQATIGIEAEIIVVDNASADGTADIVRDRFPGVRLVRLARNTGFAHACNIGIADAQGRYAGFLNPDAAALSHAFSHLIRFLDQHPRAAVAGGTLLNTDHTVQPSVHAFPTPLTAMGVMLKFPHLPILKKWFTRDFSVSVPVAAPQKVDYVKGAFFVARHAFLKETGGFDERFFLWFDEVDLQRQARERGWDVWHYPKARAWHAHAASFSVNDATRNQCIFIKSMITYIEKWYGVLRALPLRFIQPLALLAYRIVKWHA